MDFVISLLFCLVGAVIIYLQAVCEEERRTNKHIPLIWEKEFWK